MSEQIKAAVRLTVYCDENRARSQGRHEVKPDWQDEPTPRVVFECCGLNYISRSERWAKTQTRLVDAGLTKISLLNLTRLSR